MTGYSTVWASILAFACILLVLGLLLCIPFVLSRMRGVNPSVDRLFDSVGSFMGADPPSQQKSSKQPATKQLLRTLKVAKYAKPDDVEAAVEDCCAICCCEFEAGEPVIRLGCSHHFHKDCIIAWLKVDAVCPICKTHLVPPQPQHSKAPDCHCPLPQASPLRAPPPAAAPAGPSFVAAGMSPALAEGSSSLVLAAAGGSAAGQHSVAAAAAVSPAAPHARSPHHLQNHAFSSPMVGVAGVSP